MKNQHRLNQYFRTEWSGNTPYQKYAGPALIGKINPGERVIDVGCGDNFFKGKIPNLIGIDPANDLADIHSTLEDFTTDEKFDVAFCLGSINFGEYTDILRQLEKLNSLMNSTARIFWRCNPGRQDHNTIGCKDITFFPWSEELHYHFAEKFGFTVKMITWDTNLKTNRASNRLYAEWVRSS